MWYIRASVYEPYAIDSIFNQSAKPVNSRYSTIIPSEEEVVRIANLWLKQYDHKALRVVSIEDLPYFHSYELAHFPQYQVKNENQWHRVGVFSLLLLFQEPTYAKEGPVFRVLHLEIHRDEALY